MHLLPLLLVRRQQSFWRGSSIGDMGQRRTTEQTRFLEFTNTQVKCGSDYKSELDCAINHTYKCAAQHSISIADFMNRIKSIFEN